VLPSARHHPATTFPGGQVLTPVMLQQKSVHPSLQAAPEPQSPGTIAA
jgi:hypothetical protein